MSGEIERVATSDEEMIIPADFAVVECILQDDYDWGIDVLRQGVGESWLLFMAARVSRFFPSRIIPQSPDQFLAYGIAGRRLALVYRIEHAGEEKIHVSVADPVYPMTKWVVLLAMSLLSPIVGSFVLFSAFYNTWRTRCVSRRCLPVFCKYLEDRLAGRSGKA